MIEQEVYNKQYQSYMQQIKDGNIRIADIPAEYLAGPGTWLSVAALLRDGNQYSEIPAEHRNFACLCAGIVGGKAGGCLIRDTDPRYFNLPIKYAIAKGNIDCMRETQSDRITNLIREVNPVGNELAKKHPRKYKQQAVLNSFTDALQAKIVIEAMEHNCITFPELGNREKVNPYISRYAVYSDHRNIRHIPNDYDIDLISGKALKGQILNEVMSGYLSNRAKSPQQLIKQKVNHIVNEKLYELYAKNPAFTPVPDVDIMPKYESVNIAEKTRCKSSGSERCR